MNLTEHPSVKRIGTAPRDQVRKIVAVTATSWGFALPPHVPAPRPWQPPVWRMAKRPACFKALGFQFAF
jgi:hypothetical protein